MSPLAWTGIDLWSQRRSLGRLWSKIVFTFYQELLHNSPLTAILQVAQTLSVVESPSFDWLFKLFNWNLYCVRSTTHNVVLNYKKPVTWQYDEASQTYWHSLELLVFIVQGLSYGPLFVTSCSTPAYNKSVIFWLYTVYKGLDKSSILVILLFINLH